MRDHRCWLSLSLFNFIYHQIVSLLYQNVLINDWWWFVWNRGACASTYNAVAVYLSKRKTKQSLMDNIYKAKAKTLFYIFSLNDKKWLNTIRRVNEAKRVAALFFPDRLILIQEQRFYIWLADALILLYLIQVKLSFKKGKIIAIFTTHYYSIFSTWSSKMNWKTVISMVFNFSLLGLLDLMDEMS